MTTVPDPWMLVQRLLALLEKGLALPCCSQGPVAHVCPGCGLWCWPTGAWEPPWSSVGGLTTEKGKEMGKDLLEMLRSTSGVDASELGADVPSQGSQRWTKQQWREWQQCTEGERSGTSIPRSSVPARDPGGVQRPSTREDSDQQPSRPADDWSEVGNKRSTRHKGNAVQSQQPQQPQQQPVELCREHKRWQNAQEQQERTAAKFQAIGRMCSILELY